MTEVWIVIVEDRHHDVDALPFSTDDRALDEAQAVADRLAGEHDVHVGELTPAAIEEGQVLLLEYGLEGDTVRVIRRELDAVP